MAGFSVEVHPAARAELQAAFDWYFERNPAAARAFIREIDAAVAAISDNPSMWSSYIERCRRYVLRRFPFSVVYRTTGSEISIVAFAHGRRRPGYWQSR
jgi:plasmid stabilization system protein ParE